MIFIWFLARSSRGTGPKIRVPIGSPWLLISTAALESKRMVEPSLRLMSFAVRTTIVDGRPERGMQSWKDLPAETIDDLVAFLKWLNEERAELAKQVGGVGTEQPLPWWEYK